MPSNLYGVANAPIVCAVTGQGSVACPAGVQTVVMGVGPIIAPSQGFYYPACWWMIDLTYGATLPTNVQYSFRLVGGSNFDTVQLDLSSAVAGSTYNTTVCMFGPASSIPWVAPGSTVQFTMLPTGQAVQANPTSGRAWFALFRAPDQ